MSKLYQDAEKLVREQFHKGTYDGARSKMDISAIVGDVLMAKQKKDEGDWHAPKPGVIHASKLYGCLRGVFHEMIGVAADLKETQSERRMAGVFEAGHMFEDFIVDSLGDRVLERQREYKMQYKSLTLVGHSDYRVDDNGIMRIGENKSVHSDAFWYRQQEGTLVQWHNQVQLQIYLWLERKLFNNEWEGIFSYISKDDCTIDYAAVKFNPVIIDEIVIPALDLLNEAYEKAMPLLDTRESLRVQFAAASKRAQEGEGSRAEAEATQLEAELKKVNEDLIAIGNTLPLPKSAVFNDQKASYTVNWLCKYCDRHNTCAGAGWLIEAQSEVKRLNAEHKASIVRSVSGGTTPTPKAKIGIAGEE